ncbi:hypothetical protein [Nocardia terpenica]|uniref:Uncharacterized protein n=1 Tax=Nocardia terpenica TaxID=455432 RepID=A0A164K6D6_9NOCA|nr:hypothetical protein [Nocardia terpenica]KZM71083.1 hypothetical protein AWN90_41975 [Nocardia terpenica]NQE89591.1 hypothetical protein [Nocardia terpenica]
MTTEELAAAIRSGAHPKLTGDEYVRLILVGRQSAYIAEHPPIVRTKFPVPPLLEWFVSGGKLGPKDSDDEDLVDMSTLEPEPKPKREPKPRVYKSSAVLKEERAKLQSQLDSLTGGNDSDDVASINLSPFSRNRAARTAGRRRFEKLDRDIQKGAALIRKIEQWDCKIRAAEAREAKAR